MSAISGSIAASGALHGSQIAAFTAIRSGAGIQTVTAAIDGKTIYRARRTQTAGCAHRLAPTAGSPEYLSPTPCPETRVHAAPDRNGKPPGRRTLTLTVQAADAAGDHTTVQQRVFRSESDATPAGLGEVQRPVATPPEPTYQLHFSPETESAHEGCGALLRALGRQPQRDGHELSWRRRAGRERPPLAAHGQRRERRRPHRSRETVSRRHGRVES